MKNLSSELSATPELDRLGISRRKTMIVSFTGVDGSGKTSHAKSLTAYLNQNGHVSKYARSTYRPVLSYPFLAFTGVLGYWHGNRRDTFVDPLSNAPVSLRSGLLGRLLRLSMFLDFHLITLFAVRLSLARGKTVICDRYFYDVLMELIVSGLYSRRFCELLVRTTPQPAVSFLMDVSAETVCLRRKNPPPKLLEKRRIYLSLARCFNLTIVNGANDFEINQSQIRLETMESFNAQIN